MQAGAIVVCPMALSQRCVETNELGKNVCARIATAIKATRPVEEPQKANSHADSCIAAATSQRHHGHVLLPVSHISTQRVW